MMSDEDEAVLRALDRAFEGVQHDLWVGERFNVADTRLEEARRLRMKDMGALTAVDLDYLMFKSMTTMGGVNTFKFLLPRFIRAVLAEPTWGWTADSHVLLGKLEAAEFDDWPASQRNAAAAAIRLLAERLILLDLDEPGEGNEWALRAWADARMAGP